MNLLRGRHALLQQSSGVCRDVRKRPACSREGYKRGSRAGCPHGHSGARHASRHSIMVTTRETKHVGCAPLAANLSGALPGLPGLNLGDIDTDEFTSI
jgi:hypothetical protein